MRGTVGDPYNDRIRTEGGWVGVQDPSVLTATVHSRLSSGGALVTERVFALVDVGKCGHHREVTKSGWFGGRRRFVRDNEQWLQPLQARYNPSPLEQDFTLDRWVSPKSVIL